MSSNTITRYIDLVSNASVQDSRNRKVSQKSRDGEGCLLTYEAVSVPVIHDTMLVYLELRVLPAVQRQHSG